MEKVISFPAKIRSYVVMSVNTQFAIHLVSLESDMSLDLSLF